MRFAIAIVVATFSAIAAPGAEAAVPGEPSTPHLALPLTIDRVWYRAGGKRQRGDLTVTKDALEFVATKRTVSIPMDRIQVISFGKMKGDVDTDWVVLAVGVAPPYDLVGLRDGRKLGFGGQTTELYETLKTAARSLRAAQFRAPPGFTAYDDPAGECTLAIPETWSPFVQSMVFAGDHAVWGTTIFSVEPIRNHREGSATGRNDDALARVMSGRSPAIFVERAEAGRGMSCKGFSKQARKRLLERAREDALLGQGRELLQPPSNSTTSVDGCEGLRIVGRSRDTNGDEMVLELVAVARRDTLYLIGLRAPSEDLDALRKPFDTAVSSVKFSVAR